MDPAFAGKRLQQGGFAGTIFSDKKGHRRVEHNPLGLTKDLQIKRIMLAGWIPFLKKCDFLEMHTHIS